MEKLKGKYISHKIENNELIVFIKNKKGDTDIDTITTRCKIWNKAGIKTQRKIDELIEIHQKEVLDIDWQVKEIRFQAKLVSLQEKMNYQFKKMKLYQQIHLDASAGLPIDKYWEEKYDGRRAEEEKKSKGYGLLKNTVEMIANKFNLKRNQTVTKEKRIMICNELKKKGFNNVSDATVRTTLQRLGLSKERMNK